MQEIQIPNARLTQSESFVGDSVVMVDLKHAARLVPAYASLLLIQGDTGSGKESLARFIHENSLRSECPFVPVDCASLSDVQFEAELFGCVKNAVPGATRDSLGFIRAAHGGSVYLDEVSQLSLPLQTKVLEVLRNKVVIPVGDITACPVDVRFFVGTSCDLAAMVQQGLFHAGLYNDLRHIVLKTPTLAARRQDILPLAHHFLRVQADLYREPMKRISDPVATVLQNYAWPGNVRELVNMLEQAHVLASGQTIELGDIPLRMQNPAPQVDSSPQCLSLEDVERKAILTALKRCNYNKAKASRLLGVNIQRLKRRIARFGLQSLVEV